MKLSEIFMHLTYGELSQLNLGGSESGGITEENYPKVVSHINLALTALYKRFTLKEGELTVQLREGRLLYPLTSAYAVANRRSRQEVRHIMDTVAEPFEDDILKVEGVYATTGKEFGLNDDSDPYSVHTPTSTTLRVPSAVVQQSPELPDSLKTLQLRVVYRATHNPIVIGLSGFDPARVDVELPVTHLEPLLLYVASRVNNPIGMANEFHAGNSYAAKYEMSCQELEAKNLVVDQGSQNSRIERNGWV